MNTASGATRRRVLLVGATLAVAAFGWVKFNSRERQMARVAPFVRPKDSWTAEHLYNFLQALPSDAMLGLKTSLGLLPPSASTSRLAGPVEDAKDVQKHAVWLSSNVLTYPFRDKLNQSHHDLVMWVSQSAGVPLATLQSAPTFALEREVHKLLFAQLWDRLTPKQRRELLEKLDPAGTIKDKASVAALGGAGALAVLSATVAFTGFAFYTTMSVTIAAVAAAVGVTLPFAAYATLSTIVGILAGPVGWAILGTTALAGIAIAGRPNVQKTAQLIIQIHALKVEALVAAGVPEHEVFGV